MAFASMQAVDLFAVAVLSRYAPLRKHTRQAFRPSHDTVQPSATLFSALSRQLSDFRDDPQAQVKLGDSLPCKLPSLSRCYRVLIYQRHSCHLTPRIHLLAHHSHIQQSRHAKPLNCRNVIKSLTWQTQILDIACSQNASWKPTRSCLALIGLRLPPRIILQLRFP